MGADHSPAAFPDPAVADREYGGFEYAASPVKVQHFHRMNQPVRLPPPSLSSSVAVALRLLLFVACPAAVNFSAEIGL